MKRITRFKKRTWVLLGVVAVIAAMASVGAYAYFTSTGSGDGTASVGTSTDWDVQVEAETGGPMYPGGGPLTYVDIDYAVQNDSTGNQSLANVNIKVANDNGSPWSVVTCDADDFALSLNGGTTFAAAGADVDDTSLAGNINPGDTTVDSTVTIKMIDNGNQDDCKDVDVPLYFYAT